MHQRIAVAGVVLLMVSTLSALAPVPAGAQPESAAAFVPVTDAMLENPAPGDWLLWRRTPDGWGFRSRCLVTR